jgi:pSer/pThr/pTyr-binding forkhead associated (FHA) protein
MHYKFVLIDPDSGGEQAVWVLPPPVTVGRSPDAEVSIGAPSLSRRHCQFSVDAQGALSVRDLGSTNGTYVNDSRITKTVLQPGTVVQIGGVRMRVEWTTDEKETPPSDGTASDVKVTQPMKALKR